MSNKFLAGMSLLIIFACALIFVITRGVWIGLTDKNRVTTLANRIADFDLLEDYQADYAIEVLDYTIVTYISADKHGHIAFLQAPEGIIPNEQVATAYITGNSFDTHWSDEVVINSSRIIVRGQPATATITERTNGEGQRYRSMNLVFEGREGIVLLVVNQPISQWDDNAIEAFINSIR